MVVNRGQSLVILVILVINWWLSPINASIKLLIQETISATLSVFATAHKILVRLFLLSASCMRKLTDSSDPLADNPFGHFEVIGRLQIDPVLRRLAKNLAEK